MTIDTKAMRKAWAKSTDGGVTTSKAEMLSIADEIDSLRADVTHWIMVADGVNHDPRCSNHSDGYPRHGLCMRCKREGLLAAVMDAGVKGDALADAVDRLVTEAACQVLSHDKQDQHGDTHPCPVAVRIESALAAWRGR